MTSILEQFRAKAQAVQENNEGKRVEPLVNDQEIKQDETTMDTNERIEEGVKEVTVAQEKLQSLLKVIENDNSLESTNTMVSAYLTVLKNKYGVAIESTKPLLPQINTVIETLKDKAKKTYYTKTW